MTALIELLGTLIDKVFSKQGLLIILALFLLSFFLSALLIPDSVMVEIKSAIRGLPATILSFFDGG